MKRAQAAMEFLVTYGWAILAMLVVISSLAYFGVFSPDRIVSERCVASTGISCVDQFASTTDSTIHFTVKNGPTRAVLRNDAALEAFTATGINGDCTNPQVTFIDKTSNSIITGQKNLAFNEEFGVIVRCENAQFTENSLINAKFSLNLPQRGSDLSSIYELDILVRPLRTDIFFRCPSPITYMVSANECSTIGGTTLETIGDSPSVVKCGCSL